MEGYFGGNVHDFQKAQKARILGCYSNTDEILKSETAEDKANDTDKQGEKKDGDGDSDDNGGKKDGDADDEDHLVKGGEGSRGGKVVGHTSSGKPIYDHFDHSKHSDYSKHDHADAAAHHDYEGRKAWDASQEAEDAGNKEEADKHEANAKHHDEQHLKHNYASLSDKQKEARKNAIK